MSICLKMPANLEIKLYRDDSERMKELELCLVDRGYQVKTIITSSKEPTISSKTVYAHGYLSILTHLGLI